MKKICLMLSLCLVLLSPSTLFGAAEVDPFLTQQDLLSMSDSEFDSYVNSLEMGEYKPSGKEQRVAPIIAAIGAIFGAAVAGYIVYKVGEMGSYAACRRYNDSNGAWDLYCDSSGFFAD